MPRDGNGNFELDPAHNPVVTGTLIESEWANDTLQDVAASITGSIARDGQAPPTADIPWGNNKITGLKVGTTGLARNDAINIASLQDKDVTALTSLSMLNNAITASTVPAFPAYVYPQMFSFILPTTNTAAVTLNINGLGVKEIKKYGGLSLASGDIIAGGLVVVIYNGTYFSLISEHIEQTPPLSYIYMSGNTSFAGIIGEGVLRGRTVSENVGGYTFDDVSDRYGLVVASEGYYDFSCTVNGRVDLDSVDIQYDIAIIRRRSGVDTVISVIKHLFNPAADIASRATFEYSKIIHLLANDSLRVTVYGADPIAYPDRLIIDDWTVSCLQYKQSNPYVLGLSNLIAVSNNLSSVSDAVGGGGGGGSIYLSVSSSLETPATATGSESLALGIGATASGARSIACGFSAITSEGQDDTLAFGRLALAVVGADTVFGAYSTASGGQSTALGANATASGGNSLAIGNASISSGGTSTAFGAYSTASGARSLAIGRLAVTNVDDSVALGNESVGIANEIGNELYSGVAIPTNGAISISVTGAERQIRNMAGGVALTDGVNIAQLSAVSSSLQASINTTNSTLSLVSDAVGGGGTIYQNRSVKWEHMNDADQENNIGGPIIGFNTGILLNWDNSTGLTGYNNHIGVYRMSPSSGLLGVVYENFYPIKLDGGVVECEYVFLVYNILTRPMAIGITTYEPSSIDSSNKYTDPTGIFCRIDDSISPFLQFICIHNGSVGNVLTTSITAVVGDWYKVYWVSSNSGLTYEFFVGVNGVTPTSVGTFTVTPAGTYLFPLSPETSVKGYGNLFWVDGGTGSGTAYIGVDYLYNSMIISR